MQPFCPVVPGYPLPTSEEVAIKLKALPDDAFLYYGRDNTSIHVPVLEGVVTQEWVHENRHRYAGLPPYAVPIIGTPLVRSHYSQLTIPVLELFVIRRCDGEKDVTNLVEKLYKTAQQKHLMILHLQYQFDAQKKKIDEGGRRQEEMKKANDKLDHDCRSKDKKINEYGALLQSMLDGWQIINGREKVLNEEKEQLLQKETLLKEEKEQLQQREKILEKEKKALQKEIEDLKEGIEMSKEIVQSLYASQKQVNEEHQKKEAHLEQEFEKLEQINKDHILKNNENEKIINYLRGKIEELERPVDTTPPVEEVLMEEEEEELKEEDSKENNVCPYEQFATESDTEQMKEVLREFRLRPVTKICRQSLDGSLYRTISEEMERKIELKKLPGQLKSDVVHFIKNNKTQFQDDVELIQNNQDVDWNMLDTVTSPNAAKIIVKGLSLLYGVPITIYSAHGKPWKAPHSSPKDAHPLEIAYYEYPAPHFTGTESIDSFILLE